MNGARFATGFAIGGGLLLALLAFVACTSGDEPALEVPPGATPETRVGPEASVIERDAALDADAPPRCSKDGFCYVHVPIATWLVAISASNVDDAWMAGPTSILHWDGEQLLHDYESPVVRSFAAIWAERTDALWAAGLDENGELVLVRRAPPASGGPPTYRELRTGQQWYGFRRIWVTPEADQLWTTSNYGSESVILRFREAPSGELLTESYRPRTGDDDTRLYRWYAVWGFGPADLFVSGSVAASAGDTQEKWNGALAHYDGTTWSIEILNAGSVISLRGTPPGEAPHLWYDVEGTAPRLTTYLAPVRSDGALGDPIFSSSIADYFEKGCSSGIGYAATPTSGWFSGGPLVCQFASATLKPVTTALSNGAVVRAVNGVWAGSHGEAWIVGSAKPPIEGLPDMGFAALRASRHAGGEP